MVQNCMIAVCDILGFSELVKNQPVDEIVNSDLAYLRKALQFAVSQSDWPAGIPMLQHLRNQKRVGFAWFSDTFLFYSLEDTEDGYCSVIETVASLIFTTIWVPCRHIRAGIAYGEMYIDQTNGLYVGRALVDAYELEKKQEWSGGALTSSAVEKVPNCARQERIYPWYVVPYKVPVKPIPSTFETLAIDWTMALHPNASFRWSETSPVPPSGTHDNIARKFTNTRNFHDQVCGFCRQR